MTWRRWRRGLAWGVAALLAVAALRYLEELRTTAIAEAPLLRSHFDHADHRRTGCIDCHHNFRDKTGAMTCYNCHKVAMAQGVTRIDVLFHDFCTGCHREEISKGNDSGPVKSCSACHAEGVASTPANPFGVRPRP